MLRLYDWQSMCGFYFERGMQRASTRPLAQHRGCLQRPARLNDYVQVDLRLID